MANIARGKTECYIAPRLSAKCIYVRSTRQGNPLIVIENCLCHTFANLSAEQFDFIVSQCFLLFAALSTGINGGSKSKAVLLLFNIAL